MTEQAIDTLFKQALEHHLYGRLQEAETLYRTILHIQPNHRDANRNLSVLLAQHMTECLKEAESLYQRIQETPPSSQAQVGASSVTKPPSCDDGFPLSQTSLPERESLITLFQAGRFDECAVQAQQLSKRYPQDAFAWKAYGTALVQLGRNEAALTPLRQAESLDPQDADIPNTLGIVLANLGRLEEAAAHHRQALRLKPDDATANNNLGAVLKDLRQWSEAEAAYRHAIALQPEYAEPHNNLGQLLKERGQLSEAEVSCRHALALAPDYAQAHNTLGAILKDLGRLDEAETSYRRALEARPHFAHGHNNLGTLLWESERLSEAEDHYRQALAIDPNYLDAHQNLANLLTRTGRLNEVVPVYRQALKIQPGAAALHFHLGNALQWLGRLNEAEASYQRALELSPDFAEALNSLGILYVAKGRLSEAEAIYRRALTLKPDLAEAYNNLGSVLRDLGRLAEAESSHRQALALRPHKHEAYCNLLFTLAYTAHRSPAEIRRESEGWEQAIVSAEARQAAHQQRFSLASRHHRRLRVGLLSAELGQHAVAYFLLPWLRALDSKRIELHLYPTRARVEPQVAAFQALDASWTPLLGLSDTEAAERIRADQIDVLIETSGHTTDNRLGIIARRAAPVQCTYIGYFATTGLTEMDYFLADDTLIPPELDEHFTEQVWRLPRPWVAYDPLETAPEPTWQPDPNGTVWLGSFNKLTKIREDCLDLWASVLRALPEAKLLLKDAKSADPGTQQRIRTHLSGRGIDEARVVFAGRDPSWQAHMAQYGRLDLALDPIPMTGGSTAFDALWMGLPLVTLAGDRLLGRQGAAALAGLGRSEWIARDAQDYVDIAVALARDGQARRQIRATQREQMHHSPLCDGAGLARALEDACEAMFDHWWNSARPDS